MVPNSPDHRQEISPSLHQRRAIVSRDAANGDRGDFEHLMPPGQDFRRGAVGGFLAFGREKGTKGDVIRAQFAGFHGQMAGCMAGDAKNAPFQQAPGIGMVAITLTKMRAITAKLGRKRRVIIQQKRHITGRRDGHEDIRGSGDVIFRGVLEAQLQAGDIARIQSG